MIKLRKYSTDQASHEDLFLERYERLLAFARQLRGMDAQRAEDIVHDAFVQFIAYLNQRLRDKRLEGLVKNLFRPSFSMCWASLPARRRTITNAASS